MNELGSILDVWRRGACDDGVLATVVHVEGSAYRRPGARMLIQAGGHSIGTISGGCLEKDLIRKAGWWTAGGETALRVYDTSSGEDAAWEFGLGCNGVIHLLLERTDSPSTQAMLAHLDAARQARRSTVVVTVIRTSGSRFRLGEHFLSPEEHTLGVGNHAAEALANRRSRLVRTPEADFFVEYVDPPPRVVIFGSGHDVVPVVNASAALGWSVTVADARGGQARPERFPGAERVVALRGTELRDLEIDEDTSVVFMTHSFPLDTGLLPLVWPLRPRYLGLLGPWSRTERLFRETGIEPRGANLHAPVGLDLGGEAPEAVALSIVAEIHAAWHGRDGRSLRWRTSPIHDAVEHAGVAPSLLRGAEATVSAVCEAAYV